MPSTNEHIAARDDLDLQHRLIAAAEQAGIDNAASRVAQSLGALVSRTIEVNGQTTSVTAVHAYANGQRAALLASDAALPAGLNPAAVTDAHLQAAVMAVLGEAAPTE